MRYIKKKIEKKELINQKLNNLYLKIYKKRIKIIYNNISINFYYNNNTNIIKKYFKEVGII